MSKFNDFQTLLTAAEAYLSLGYVVIPLLGDLDPTRPKVAACSWGMYQRQRSTLIDAQTWFSAAGKSAALGIVTGSISQLVVLDFDSQAAFTEFSRRCPDLLETHTVRSAGRGLPHLYFRLPHGLYIASQKVIGVDLLSDGRYVVAPPSIIDGQPYKIVRGGMPRPLTAHDIRRITTFLTTYKSPSPIAMGEGRGGGLPSLIAMGEGWGGGLLSPITMKEGRAGGKPTRANLHALYTYWLAKGGRNDALFRTALHARDHGWDESQTRRALITLHVNAPIVKGDKGLPHLRQREAAATIHSAFSRPARVPRVRHSPIALPNSAREWLMQHGMTYVVRTFEGLIQQGYREKQVLTAEQAIERLKGIVGRDSVYKALNALAPNGKPIFRRKAPSALPTAANAAAHGKSGLKTKKCFFVTEKKSGIKKRGRQHRLYVLPSNHDICRLLGVKHTGSDSLTRDDLTSARQTRMALHRELIKRRPAEYSRGWLAGRLGVSRRTLDTYNHLIPIHRQPAYNTTDLAWTNLERLPLDEAQPGAFIETLYGKKYPALRTIASRLLAKGTFIRLKERRGSYYWYGTDEPPIPPPSPIAMGEGRGGGVPSPIAMEEGRGESVPFPIAVEQVQPKYVPSPIAMEENRGRCSPSPIIIGESRAGSSRFRKPLTEPAQETLAQHIYTRVNQRTTDAKRHLSLSNARRLVATYGAHHVSQALRMFENRQQLDNPTGFFVTVLRSSRAQPPLEIKKGKA